MKKEKTKQLTDLEIAIKLEEIDREPKKETIEELWLEYRSHTNSEDAWQFKEWLIKKRNNNEKHTRNRREFRAIR